MGLSGASSKKRKAKKLAAAAYIKAIREAKFGGDPIPEIDQAGRRGLEREYGGTGLLGGRERRLAREADQLAEQANAVRGDYNRKLERYNKRKEIADAQLKGKTVRDPAKLAEVQAEIDKVLAEEKAFRGNDEKPRGMLQSMLKKQEKPTAEQQARALKLQQLNEDRKLYSGGYGPARGYRELHNLESAYDDLARMSYEAQGYVLKPEVQKELSTLRGQQAREKMDEAIASDKKIPGAIQGLLGSGTFSILGGPPSTGIADIAPKAMRDFRLKALQKFTPANYVKDPNSAAEKLRTNVTQYNGIADKLKQNLQRKAAGGQVLAASAQQADLAGSDLAGSNLEQERFA